MFQRQIIAWQRTKRWTDHTCLETPGLVGHEAGCSFSKSTLFRDTSSSRCRVRWVTSGDFMTSDFYKHIKSLSQRKENTEVLTKTISESDLCSLIQPLHFLFDGPGWNSLPGAVKISKWHTSSVHWHMQLNTLAMTEITKLKCKWIKKWKTSPYFLWKDEVSSFSFWSWSKPPNKKES